MGALVLLILLLVALVVWARYWANTQGKNNHVAKDKEVIIKRRRVLTINEQPTFDCLLLSLPEYRVLAQVAFTSIITTTDPATRNRFNRKVADFVVCDRSFNVVAVIEIDDSSHKSSKAADAKRDMFFELAGIKVLRYCKTPNGDDIRKTIQGIEAIKKINNRVL